MFEMVDHDQKETICRSSPDIATKNFHLGLNELLLTDMTIITVPRLRLRYIGSHHTKSKPQLSCELHLEQTVCLVLTCDNMRRKVTKNSNRIVQKNENSRKTQNGPKTKNSGKAENGRKSENGKTTEIGRKSENCNKTEIGLRIVTKNSNCIVQMRLP